MSSYYPYNLPILAPVPPEVIIQVDKIVWISHTLWIASLSVGFWDWLVCAEQEYRLIWRRPFSIATYLYFWTRYGYFVSAGITAWVWLGGWDTELCMKRYLIGPGWMCCVEFSAMAILFMRTFAVWKQAWYIAVICISAMLGYLGTQIYNLKTQFVPVPIFRSQGPCIASAKESGIGAVYFAYPLAYDVLVTILLFIKLVPIMRQSNMSNVVRKLFREGAFYFLVISTGNAANTALLASKISNNALLVPISFVLQATLTSRMILSLRDSGENESSHHPSGDTKSFWSRVKGDTTRNQATSGFSVNVHKIETTVIDQERSGSPSYELEEKNRYHPV